MWATIMCPPAPQPSNIVGVERMRHTAANAIAFFDSSLLSLFRIDSPLRLCFLQNCRGANCHPELTRILQRHPLFRTTLNDARRGREVTDQERAICITLDISVQCEMQ